MNKKNLNEIVTTSVSDALKGDPKTRPAVSLGIKRRNTVSVLDFLEAKNKKNRYNNHGG